MYYPKRTTAVFADHYTTKAQCNTTMHALLIVRWVFTHSYVFLAFSRAISNRAHRPHVNAASKKQRLTERKQKEMQSSPLSVTPPPSKQHRGTPLKTSTPVAKSTPTFVPKGAVVQLHNRPPPFTFALAVPRVTCQRSFLTRIMCRFPLFSLFSPRQRGRHCSCEGRNERRDPVGRIRLSGKRNSCCQGHFEELEQTQGTVLTCVWVGGWVCMRTMPTNPDLVPLRLCD